MFHVRPKSQFVAFTVVFLAAMHSCRGQHLVIGPSEPVVALVGEDVTLPCHLNPPMNVFEMTQEWARPDLNPRFVFVWRDGVELKSKKHPLYEGRTSLFTEELKNGNISMKLSKVRLSDEGEYKCFVPDVGESKVQLVVGVVSTPVIEFVSNKSTEVVLQCEAKGWYSQPEVFWLDGEGNLLSAGPTETVRGPDDLYTVRRRLTVEKRDRFTCRVQQKNITQTRETHFYVPDGFFVVPSTSSQHVVVGSVIGCAALMVFLSAVCVWWRRKQRKSKNKTTSPEDGAGQTEEHETITPQSEDTEFQIEMEEEAESVPLMAARGEKNEDNRGEIKSQSEHEDAEFVMERETQQDQLRTKPEAVTCNQDMDVTGGGRTTTSMNDEEVTLIPTQETQRHQHQDNLLGRQGDKTEGEKTIKPVKEVSGLPVVLAHTDQEVQKEEETQQEQLTEERQPENDVDKKEAETKKKKERERAQQKGSGWKKQPENQRERMKQKAERQKTENKRKRELELERRRERVKDETEVEPQRDGDRHLLEDTTQEESQTEHEDDKGNDQEGNQRELQRGRKLMNQKEQIEKLERTDEKRDDRGERGQQLPSVSREVPERTNLKIHQETAERKQKEVHPSNSSGDQQLLGEKTEKSEAEDENKKGNDQEGNQRELVRTTERTAENQSGQMNQNLKETEEERKFESEGKEKINSNTENIELRTQTGNGNHVMDTTKQEAEHEDKKREMTGRKLLNQKEQIDKLERTDEKRDVRETKPPSVSTEVPERPNLKIHQEPAERKNKEVQEKQEETREQPERSTEAVNVEFEERRSDKGADDDETQETTKETKKQAQLQAAKEETREQPQNLQSVTEGGVKPQDVQQVEEMEDDPTPDTENDQRKIMRNKREQTKQVQLSQQQSARRKRHQGKNREQPQNLQSVNEQNHELEPTKQLHVVQQQAAERKEHQEETREQPQNLQSVTEGGVKLQDVQQVEEMEDEPTADTENDQRKIMRNKRERTKQVQLSQQQSARRKRHQGESRVKTRRKIKELSDLQMEVKQCPRWSSFSPLLNDVHMEDIHEGHTEQQVIHEPQRWDLNSQPSCQEHQQVEEEMETEEGAPDRQTD